MPRFCWACWRDYDPSDPATAACLIPGNCFSDYTRFLDKKALRGARIAVTPFPANRLDLMNAAVDALRAAGAHVELIRRTGARSWGSA